MSNTVTVTIPLSEYDKLRKIRETQYEGVILKKYVSGWLELESYVKIETTEELVKDLVESIQYQQNELEMLRVAIRTKEEKLDKVINSLWYKLFGKIAGLHLP